MILGILKDFWPMFVILKLNFPVSLKPLLFMVTVYLQFCENTKQFMIKNKKEKLFFILNTICQIRV